MRLRSHLLVLVFVATLPLLVFASVIVMQTLDERRQILDRGMHETVEAFTSAVDGEVKASLAVLETLASSALLDVPELESFHLLCTKVTEKRPGSYVILFDASGAQLVNSSRPIGSRLPNPFQSAKPPGTDARYPGVPVGGDAHVRKVLETGRPFVSDLFVSLLTGAPRIGLAVPVFRDGRVRYALELSLDAIEFARFLSQQRAPSDSALTVVDRRGIAIARTVDARTSVGRPLPPDLARQIEAASEGSGRGRDAQGAWVYQVFNRSELTGWTTSLSVREETAFAPLDKSFLALGSGAAIALLLAAGAALFVGRRVSQPIAALAGSAQAMARGEAAGVGVSNVAELRELQGALVTAGSAVRSAAEDRERAVVDHVLDAIITIDERGTIESFNPAASRIFGYERAEVLGQNIRMLMPESYRAQHEQGLAWYLRTGKANIIGIGREVEGRRKDGQVFPVDIAVSEVRVGLRRWFIGILRDITERKQAETALKEASRAKDEFLAMLSHELRNPLAALTTASHVMSLVDPASEQAGDARRVIERQTRHMTRLISDLLDISRLSLGKLALQREHFDVGESVSHLAAIWRDSGRFEQHEVTVSVERAWIHGDRARIDQIVANLVDNALKFTPAGKAVAIAVRSENGAAVLEVRDQGSGISHEERERVFGLFAQGKASRHAGPGLGIGLALVKQLAESHGGSVTVSSDGPGRGAAFLVRLPQEAPRTRTAEAPAASGKAKPCSILIVEDNDDARGMLQAMLSWGGHDVRSAPDGRTGVAMAVSAPPTVALIDIDLPDMDGYEVAHQLRRLETARPIGIVALTGFGQVEDQQRAYKAGFDAHLVKPVSAERLHQVIQELS